MTSGLELRDLEISLNGRIMVALSARVAPGETLCLIGPSGCGKSTLLSALSGHLAGAFRLRGEIFLNGQDLRPQPPHARRIGMLFQDALLFPHLSVGGNLALGLPPGGSRIARRARIDAALAQVGLEGFAARDPATLSGGQQARVALMRTVLSEPQALLLDEPFSRLDTALRAQVRTLTFERAKSLNIPVILVTHDAEDVAAAKGQVIELGQT